MTTPVFVGNFAPGSPAWHTARVTGIGGSEIAAVLGLSPWESRFSLWHRKKGLASPTAENDVMYWGSRLEAVIREEWNLRHPDALAESVGTYRHFSRPWQIANPDGRIAPKSAPHSLLEVKTARDTNGWGEPGTDEVPVYYRTQCLWYLDVFGLDVCHVAVLFSGSDYQEYRVERSNEEMALMRDKAVEFLDTVTLNIRPNIDEHDATYQVVRELHPDIEDMRVDITGPVATPYLEAIAAHKTATEEKQRTSAVLLDAMGTARRAFFDGDQIAMRVPGRGDNPPSLRAQPTPKSSGLKVSAA